MKKSTVFQIAGGVAIAVACLWVFLQPWKNGRLDFSVVSHLWNNLRSTPMWVVAGVAGLTVLTLWLRGIRWNLILPESPSAFRQGLFGILVIGFMINNILPARLGEAARVLLLWKRNRFTIAESAGSVLLERIFDTIVYLSFFFIPALFLSGLRQLIPYAIPMAVGAGAAVCALLFYAFFPAQSRSLAKVFLKFVPVSLRLKVLTIGKELSSNLNWISSPGKCLAMMSLSIVIIACYPAMLALLVCDTSFDVLSSMFGAAWGAIGAAIPGAPGYVGTLHYALKKGLMFCGIEDNKAIAVATLYHAIGYTTTTVLGLYYFLRLRISFKEIGHAKDELDKGGSAPKSPADIKEHT